jgi:hypothetical protein
MRSWASNKLIDSKPTHYDYLHIIFISIAYSCNKTFYISILRTFHAVYFFKKSKLIFQRSIAKSCILQSLLLFFN